MLKEIHREADEKMAKALEALEHEFGTLRTGRASLHLLDGISVDAYGTPQPLKAVSTLSTPDAHTIMVTPWDKNLLGSIERAILAGNLGVTPNNDGKVIRISIPALTEERRKDLVKQVRKMAEEHRVGVREGRRDGLSMLKDLEKDGTLGKDDHRRGEKMVQDVTDEYIKKIDEMTTKKEEEVLEV